MTMIELKTGEMRRMFEVASALCADPATGTARQWPAQFSYWLARLITRLQAEYETSEKARLTLAEQHGIKTEDGQSYTFESEAAEQFTAGFHAVLNTDLSLELPSLPETSLVGFDIAPGDLLVFDKLIAPPA